MTQASEPNPPTATVRMDRPAALGIRNHRPAASTMAAPRVSSPTPSRRWCGSRSRAPRPTARAANPTAPATSIQAAAIILPVQLTRITTGSRGGGPWAGRRPADRPWAVRPLPVPGLPDGFRLLFFLGAERVWLPCPCLRRGPGGPATWWPRGDPQARGQPRPARRAGGQIRYGHGSPFHHRSENPRSVPSTAGACRLTAQSCTGSGASRGSRTAGRARGPGRCPSRPGAGSGARRGRRPRRPGPR